MTVDDLSAPLGQGNSRRRPLQRLPGIVSPLAIGALSLSLMVFAAWAMIADDPFGGEPMAVARVDLRQDAKPRNDAPDKPAAAGPEDRGAGSAVAIAPPPGSKTVTIIDGSSGKRQEVVIPKGDGDGAAATADERLAERSRHGLLPRIAEDGARPSEVFASAAKSIPGRPNAPRIAIIVGGLGIGATTTEDAIKKLPGAVTFAFAPYGGDLERQVARARADGHEMLLQVPMEPFDYPDNDPGPHTLLTSLDAAQNVDRLQWLMARFQGYVGLTNAMGARFTASDQALTPVLREAARRGLIYVDDGTSQRSLASQVAGASNLPFVRADVVLDAVPTGADVDRALARLESIARERGSAVGTANALPVSIERIARWAKAAESRGLLLVPITAIAARTKAS